MKKILLPIALLAGAVCANAQDVVYFEDNFDWLKPWVDFHDLGDPVGTNNPDANGVSIKSDECGMIGTNGGNIFHEMTGIDMVGGEETKYNVHEIGYQTRIWPNAGAYWTFIAYNSYLRIGSAGHNGGLRTGNVSITDDPTELYLEFDWCPCKNEDGTWHDVELDVEYRPGNLTVADGIVYGVDIEDKTKPLAWKHECIDLFDTDGLSTGPASDKAGQGCNVVIEISKSSALQQAGCNNFYLDNIRLASAKLPSGIKDVVVENDRTMPVEYFNLQGVRVNNPENGIFIRRQGKKVSKVAL